MELLAPIVTASGPEAQYFFLNPANGQYFKSLASEALAREKFRFTRLRLRYWNQAPSSRSGVISGVILMDPLQAPPSDPQGYMSYSHSFTRAISLDGASVPHQIVDPKWYYTAGASTAVNATDPTTRYQGLVAWQSQGAASSDTGLISGYIGLEYTCQLMGRRMVRDEILAATPLAQQAFLGGETGKNKNLSYDTIPSCIGSYDLQVEGQSIDASSKPTKNVAVPGYSSEVTLSNSLISYLGKHAINYFLPLGVAAVAGVQVQPDKGFIPRPSVHLFRAHRKASWTCEVGGAIVDVIPNWVEVVCAAKDDEKSGVLLGPLKVSELRTDCEYSLRSNTAGDVTTILYSYMPNSSGAAQTVSSLTSSSGTGAINIRQSVQWTETVPECRLSLQVIPTGVETRSISSVAGAGTFAYNEFAGDEDLL